MNTRPDRWNPPEIDPRRDSDVTWENLRTAFLAERDKNDNLENEINRVTIMNQTLTDENRRLKRLQTADANECIELRTGLRMILGQFVVLLEKGMEARKRSPYEPPGSPAPRDGDPLTSSETGDLTDLVARLGKVVQQTANHNASKET